MCRVNDVVVRIIVVDGAKVLIRMDEVAASLHLVIDSPVNDIYHVVLDRYLNVFIPFFSCTSINSP